MRRIALFTCAAFAAARLTAVSVTPDVFGVTIPPNIAPLNADVLDVPDGAAVALSYHAADGAELTATGLRFSERDWRTFMGGHAGQALALSLVVNGTVLLTVTNAVSPYPVDSHLTYRLVPPGYEGFSRVGVFQRELASFRTRTVFRNEQTSYRQCMNCHTYNLAHADTWMFHVRDQDDCTVIESPKYGLRKVDLKTPGLIGVCTYPAWHPSGDFLAFSVNETRQLFYQARPDKVEVADLTSDLVEYSIADGEMLPVETGPDRFECYPAWSPDGRSIPSCGGRV